MCWSSRTLLSLLLASSALPAAAIEGYILGASAEADTADGRALSGFMDLGLAEDTWLSAGLAKTDTGGSLGGLNTIYADVALEHSFGVAGVRVGGAYWGDDDLLDSADARASIFFRGDVGSVSFDYERRNFEFVFRPIIDPTTTREATFHANGLGGAAFLNAGDNVGLFVSGMVYDYSRNLRIQENVDTLRRFSQSRLSLMNSLIDHRVSAGFDVRLGRHGIDLTFSNWQTAIDGGQVNSISVGTTLAVADAFDLDIRVAYDDPENYDHTIALAISVFYFGR